MEVVLIMCNINRCRLNLLRHCVKRKAIVLPYDLMIKLDLEY